MNKTLILSSLAVMASGSLAFGAATTFGTINDANFSNVTVADASGTLIANGAGYAAIGGFSIDDATIAGANAGALAAAFTEYASTTFGGANAGNAEGIALANSGAIIPDSLNNASVYHVFGNAATLADSSEWAVVKSADTFIDDDPGSPVPAPFKSQISGIDASNVIAGSLIGGIDSATLVGLGAPGANNTVQLVPEASTAILSLLGLGLIFRRRR